MGLIVLNNKVITLGGAALSIEPPETPEIYVSPSEITGVSYLGTYYDVNVCGNPSDTTTVTDACNWIVSTSPVSPSASPGTLNTILICENLTSSCRSGVVCYTPSLGGSVKCVTICQSTGDTAIYVTPATISSISASGQYFSTSCIKVCGPTSNSTSAVSACNWIVVCNTPISPSATPGTSSCVCVCSNAGAARAGYITYTPTVGTARCVCFCQDAGASTPLDLCSQTSCSSIGLSYCSACLCGIVTGGDCACICTCYYVDTLVGKTSARACILCNSSPLFACTVTNGGNYTTTYDFIMRQGDSVIFCAYASDLIETSSAYSELCVLGVSGVVGNYCMGTCVCISALAGLA